MRDIGVLLKEISPPTDDLWVNSVNTHLTSPILASDFILKEAREVWEVLVSNFPTWSTDRWSFEYNGKRVLYLSTYRITHAMDWGPLVVEPKNTVNKGKEYLVALRHLQHVPIDIVVQEGGRVRKSKNGDGSLESSYFIPRGNSFSDDYLCTLARYLSAIDWILLRRRSQILADSADWPEVFKLFVELFYYWHTPPGKEYRRKELDVFSQ